MKFNTLEKSFDEIQNEENEEALDDFIESYNEDKMIQEELEPEIDFEDQWDEEIKSYEPLTPGEEQVTKDLWYNTGLVPIGDKR